MDDDQATGSWLVETRGGKIRMSGTNPTKGGVHRGIGASGDCVALCGIVAIVACQIQRRVQS